MMGMGFITQFCGNGKAPSKSKAQLDEVLACTLFTALVVYGARTYSDMLFSALVTLSACFQCLGFVIVSLKVHRSGFEGVSIRALQFYAVALTCRLNSSWLFNGYLPMDKTGERIYPTIETVSFFVVLHLLALSQMPRYRVQDETGHKDMSSTAVVFALLVVSVIAAFTHPRLNSRFVPDWTWTTALYIETIALVPQLYIMQKRGGEVDSRIAHYILIVFLARVLMVVFWFTCYPELAPKDAYLNIPGWSVMVAQFLQLLLLGDFVCLCVKSLKSNTTVVIPTAWEV
jgi:hypothetical protein